MNTEETLTNVENILNSGIDVICAGLDQDSRGKTLGNIVIVIRLI